MTLRTAIESAITKVGGGRFNAPQTRCIAKEVLLAIREEVKHGGVVALLTAGTVSLRKSATEKDTEFVKRIVGQYLIADREIQIRRDESVTAADAVRGDVALLSEAALTEAVPV
jgi:hypothetical protein